MLAALIVSVGGAAQGLEVDSFYVTGQLENGLKYYIRSTKREVGRADFQLVVKAGSLHEEDSQSGLAHFLEHVGFDGSKHFKDKGIINYMESVGVKFGENLNAHTYTDRTTYELKQVPVHRTSTVDSCLLILSDFGGDLVFTPEAIKKERGVINEEWRMRSDVSIRLGDELDPILMSGSRYAYRSPLGKMDVVNNFEPKELEAYYHTWYRPNLEAVIVVGDVDAAHVEEQIKKQFGKKTNPKNEVERCEYIVPDNEEPIYVTIRDKDIKFANFYFYFKNLIFDFDARNSVDYVMDRFLTNVVCLALNSRLHDLCAMPGTPLKQVSAKYEDYQGAHTCASLSVKGTCEPSRDAEAYRLLAKAINQIRTHGFTFSEINRAVGEELSVMSNYVSNNMPNEYYVNQCTEHFVYNNPLATQETYLGIVRSNLNDLEVADFNNVFNQMAHGIGRNFVCFGLYPDEEGRMPSSLDVLEQAVNEGYTAEVEPYVDEADMPFIAELPTPVKVVGEEAAHFGYRKWKLSNGCNVYYRPTRFLDNHVSICVRGFGGLNSFTGEDKVFARQIQTTDGDRVAFFDYVNSLGIGNFTSEQVEKMLAGKILGMRSESGRLVNEINGECVPGELRTMFEMIHVRFKERDNVEHTFQRAIENLDDFMQQAATDPMHVFDDSVSNRINPHLPMLAREDLKSLNYEQYLRLYKERFSNVGNYDIYVTGCFDADTLRAYVEQYIAPLPGKSERKKPSTLFLQRPKNMVELHFKESMQTPVSWIAIYWFINQPYGIKEELLGKALSSALLERYTTVLREQKQMVYAVGATSNYDVGVDDCCIVAAKCPLTPGQEDEALSLMLAEMDNIAKSGITDSELRNFKEYEAKTFRGDLDNNALWEDAIVLLNDWGLDDVTDYDKILNSITSKDVMNFAKKLLKAQQRVVVTMKPE